MNYRLLINVAGAGGEKLTSLSMIRMSALGQKQTWRHLQPMSASPPKADIAEHDSRDRFVPLAVIFHAATGKLIIALIPGRLRHRICPGSTASRSLGQRAYKASSAHLPSRRAS